jgi:hypothetical protein
VDLSQIEYCAAHLAGLSLSAVQEHDRSSSDGKPSMGRFVNYHTMPEVVWEEILPDHFGVDPLPPDAIASMEKAAGLYSKGRGHKKNEEWKEDTTIKQQTATREVIDAASLLASKVHNRMKELSETSS